MDKAGISGGDETASGDSPTGDGDSEGGIAGGGGGKLRDGLDLMTDKWVSLDSSESCSASKSFMNESISPKISSKSLDKLP